MIGKTVSHYKITRELGAGGMGIVYEAVDTNLDRTVALKFLPPESTRDPDAKARFIHEAKAASAIDHPNVCGIYEIDETEDGHLFLAMACYKGETLKERIARGPLPIDDALDITRQVTEGLTKAHERDIVHRDIKPANIFITDDGVVKILDFGLAKLAGLTQLTQEGTTLGTGQYMSPEQGAGRETDRRTDLWSLGVVLYEMVTGQAPFGGDHLQAVMYAIQSTEPEPVTGLRTGVPLQLERIIGKCLAKDPRERYQHAEDLLADLRVLQRQTGEESTATVLTGTAARKAPRRWPWVAGIVAAAVIGGVAAIQMFGSGDESHEAQAEPTLAVVDFRVLDDPDDVQTAAGMLELINISLIENCPIRVVSPEYLHDVRRRLYGSGRGQIEDDQVIEVARESGATLFLAGRIGSAPGTQFVTWRLVDTHSGESVGARKVEGEGLAALTDGIIAGVLPLVGDVCGIATTGSPTEVERITTESEEAYRHFAAGLLFKDQMRGIQAQSELEKAVAIDSTFALAHLELARLCWGGIAAVKDFEKARRHLERAQGLESRLGVKDRLRLDATRFHQTREFSRAVASYEEILKRWPDDRETLKDLAMLFFLFWDNSRASNVARQGYELYPEDSTFGTLYPQTLQFTGRFDDAIRITRELVGRNPTDPNLWDDLALRFLGLGMPDSAEVAVHRSLELDPRYGTGGMLPQCAYARGDIKGAISLTEQYLARDELPVSARIWRMIQQTQGFGLSALYREAGRYQESIEVMEEAKRYSGGDDSRAAWAVGNALLIAGRAKEALDVAHFMTSNFEDPRAAFYALRIRAGATAALGDLDAARVAVKQLQGARDRWGGIARALALATEAEIALAENKPRDSLDALDKMELQGVGTGGVLQDNGGGGLPDITYRELRARAHRMAGRLGKAAEVHQKLLKYYGGHALSHYALGQIYEEMDRPEDATREFNKFLDMWSEADEGLPQLVDARERLDALGIAN